MKYHISREHHFFFEQHRYIEFEGLLSNQELDHLARAIGKYSKQVRDLFRASDEVRKIVQMSRLAKIASELTHKRHLRLGFDQVVQTPLALNILEQQCCITGLVAGLLIDLDDPTGRGIYFAPALDTGVLPLEANKKYFLIVWADARAQYILQQQDPHTHELKKLGYVFGDRLKEKWHPTIIR